MASFTSSAGSKRVRPWDSCQDVEALKEMLEEREVEIESFKKQSPIMEEDIVKKLQASLQEKEGRIEELMRTVGKANAVSAFGKVFAASSKIASKNVCVDTKKTASASGKVFSSVQEASKKMKCGIENENACADAKKGVMRRLASLRQSRCVAASSEEDIDCDKGLASDSTNDEDFTVKETASDSTDDDDDDEEYTVTSTKQMGANRGKSCVDDSEKVFNGNVLNLRASIQKQIVSQMVYRPGLKHRTSKAVAEVPNLSEAHMKAILGDDLFAKASRKGKLIQVTASDDDIRTLFRGSFRKSLRYGAALVLCDGLKFAFTKASCVLKVTGVFTMY